MEAIAEKPKRVKGNKDVKEIEFHLRSYRTYKVAIKNLKNQLEWILPAGVAKFDSIGGGQTSFSISSTTENYAIDRLESKKALDLHEKKEQYQLIVAQIDSALEDLDKTERDFVQYRYIKEEGLEKIAQKMGYSKASLYDVRKRIMERLSISLSGLVSM